MMSTNRRKRPNAPLANRTATEVGFSSARSFSIALVYPPFGPAALPSLGLSILSEQLKSAGYACRTHYWNLDLLDRMPFDDPFTRLTAYRSLTERTWFPFNEWIFARELYGETHGLDGTTSVDLLNRAASLPNEMLSADTLLQLRDQASTLLGVMVDRVADADLVGISSTFFQNIPALALARRIKEASPSTTVVLGGANCDGEMGPELFQHFEFLDAVFVGESDLTLTRYVDAISAGRCPEGIPGVLSRQTPDHTLAAPEPLQNLDVLGPPDFTDWMSERRRTGLADIIPPVIALESSRGCWWGAKHHCTFCGLNANGMSYRSKDLIRFAAEAKAAVFATGAKFIYMTDNILSMSYLASSIHTSELAQPGVEYFFEVKANLRRDQIRALAASGVTAIQPGIESLSTDALKLMQKGVTAAQNIEFIRNAQEIGVRPVYNLLYGFPGEDPSWYDHVLDQAPRLFHLHPPSAVAEVEFHRFSPYHSNPDKFGIKLRPLGSYSSLYPFPRETIAKIAYMFTNESGHPPFTYARRLQETVIAWRIAYSAQAALVFADDGEEIELVDTRPDYGSRRLRLRGYAAVLYRQLRTPRTDAALVAAAQKNSTIPATDPAKQGGLAAHPSNLEATTMMFDRTDFLDDPRGWLDLYSDLGLVFEDRFEESSHWIALALPARRPKIVDRWEQTGV